MARWLYTFSTLFVLFLCAQGQARDPRSFLDEDVNYVIDYRDILLRAMIWHDASKETQDLFDLLGIWHSNLNRPPFFTSSPPTTATVGTTYEYPIVAEDPEGGTVALSILFGPSGMSLDPAGKLTWTPNETDFGNQWVEILADDGLDATHQSWSVYVNSLISAASDEIHGDTGGTVSVEDASSTIRGASVTIAPGVFSGTRTVELSEVDGEIGLPKILLPVGVNGLDGLSQGVVLSLPLDPNFMNLFKVAESDLVIYGREEGTDNWVPISVPGKAHVIHSKSGPLIVRAPLSTHGEKLLGSSSLNVLIVASASLYQLLLQPVELVEVWPNPGKPARLQIQEEVVILIHGVKANSHTWYCTENDFLTEGGLLRTELEDEYDRILTFQYRSGKPIEENAAKFLDAFATLRAGDAPVSRVDIIAHSMGGLVSRFMIEQLGDKHGISGHLKNLVMLGTPNEGALSFDALNDALGILQNVPQVSSSLNATFLFLGETLPGVYQLLPPSTGNTFYGINQNVLSADSYKTKYYVAAGVYRTQPDYDKWVTTESALALPLDPNGSGYENWGYERIFGDGDDSYPAGVIYDHYNLHCQAAANGVGQQVLEWLTGDTVSLTGTPGPTATPLPGLDLQVTFSCDQGGGFLTQAGNGNKVLVRVRGAGGEEVNVEELGMGLHFGQTAPHLFYDGFQIVPNGDPDYLAGWKTYRLSDSQFLISYIGTNEVSIWVTATGHELGVFSQSVEIRDANRFFNVPPLNFFLDVNDYGSPPDVVHITVDGMAYRAYRMGVYDSQLRAYGQASLVVDQNNNLPPVDAYRRAARVAWASLRFQNTSGFPDLLREIADLYRKQVALREFGEWLLRVRAGLSNVVGFVGATYLTGGANTVTSAAVATLVSEKIVEEVLKGYSPTQVESVVRLGFESALLGSADQLDAAASLAEDHASGSWTLETAQELFQNWSHGISQGNAAAEGLVATLPASDIMGQLSDVFVDIGSGALGDAGEAAEYLSTFIQTAKNLGPVIRAMQRADEIKRISFDPIERGWNEYVDLLIAGYTYPPIQEQPPSGDIITIDIPNFAQNFPGARPLRLVRIPAGSFLMGNTGAVRDRSCYLPDCDGEEPRHPVNLNYDFYMGETEITQAQWQAVMGTSPASDYGVGNDSPVYNVSWNDIAQANGFLVRLDALGHRTFRLPSEAEWEYACRGSTLNPNRYAPFSFGDDPTLDLYSCNYSSLFNQFMVWCGNDAGSVEAVGTPKLPNDYGLYDMHGNVWEWCQDWWHWDYFNAPNNGSAWESGDDDYRVLRGCGWNSAANACRSASRSGHIPSARENYIGFRVVLPLSP
jgi:formylglycine-generating enzyme required for sulfatase activity/pimeloyl-ACP methyl ester carboxylesterase